MAEHEMKVGDLLAALRRLGSELRDPATLTLGGSAALLLTGALDRATNDGDVVESKPAFPALLDAVRRVEVAEQAPPGWLNTSVQSYTHVLPPDYRTRLVPLGRMGRLDVSLLGRADVVLMKVYAGRTRDLQDLLAVRATEAELAHAEARIPVIAEKEPAKAAKMRAVLADLRQRLNDLPPPQPLPPQDEPPQPPPPAPTPARARGRGPRK